MINLLLIAISLFAFVANASADTLTYPANTKVTWSIGQLPGQVFDSAEATCLALPRQPGNNGLGYAAVWKYNSVCLTDPGEYSINGIFSSVIPCPPPKGGTLIAGNLCQYEGVPENPCKSGTKGQAYYQVPPGPPITGGSDGTCEVGVNNVVYCASRTDGKSYCLYDTTQSGTQKKPTSDGSVPMPSAPPPVGSEKPRIPVPPFVAPSGTCPGGTVAGGIDSSGITVCIGSGTQPSPPPVVPSKVVSPASTVTNSDGSKTTTTTTTTTNADGSKTVVTDKSTLGVDGTVSTSQSASTGKTPDGKDGETDKKDDFCKANPLLSICKNSSVSGACESISCNGDAIQCATLRANAIMECRDKKDRADAEASPLNAVGKAVVAGNDPITGLPSPKNASIINVPTSLDNTGWLGGGQFFRDKSITVSGRTIVIPFSQSADAMLALRYALMVMASLVSFKILRDAVLT